MRISDWSSDVCSSDLESKLASVPGCSELSHCATIYRLAGPPLLEARPRPGLTPCWPPGHRPSSNRQHPDLRRSSRLGAPSEGGALLQASFVGLDRKSKRLNSRH